MGAVAGEPVVLNNKQASKAVMTVVRAGGQLPILRNTCSQHSQAQLRCASAHSAG